ncbi:peptide chain release factor N(5)-glutamine methyltransferase [Flagellatimonas centrodinii]|uniref:peptide chain release factor N(5)-glutamine methyltransferase n=1 Tax=Flagellatimonas centrodinii TaxID=2806210 RepID=UPI001FEF9CDE|nr:peptide chain release factor N(5)-glutamine methyltransferase [Flagellatimonas centrodinii]ULQ45715.1 peptide chain release factor N(5)-glutamine methyltransferase [Flagellatimonas centrodinii]
MTLAQAIADALPRLAPVSDAPRQDAELLLGRLLGFSRAQLFSRLETPIPPATAAAFEVDLQRRARGEPVAYILGEWGFWTLILSVSPAVLVPRPETEVLVEWALQCLMPLSTPRVADLGTGSGAIALALASERSDIRMTGVDLCGDALAVARGNGERLRLPVQWVQADFGEWLAAAPAHDLVVGNPPYIAARDPHLPALRFEPAMALTDGHDGLNALRAIIAAAPAALKPGGWLLLEHGYDQAEPVQKLLRDAGFIDVETRHDLGDQPRASGGRWAGAGR